MRKVVGIDRKIKRAWVDAVLDRLTQTTDEAELRTFLEEKLKEELPGKESRRKTTGIVLRIWSGVPPERVALRDRAVAMLPRISGQERIWLHWGMTALAYPFFQDTAAVVGRLLSLQDDFTTAQVQGRMMTTWGDRATSKEAAQKLITTLVDWEVLRSTKTKGHFLLSRKMTASIPELQLWLLEALFAASTTDEIDAQQLLRLPESFPFTISVGVADLRRYEGFDIHRQGLDTDMVALRRFRAPQPNAIPTSPPPKLKPETSRAAEAAPIPIATRTPETSHPAIAATTQPLLFDLHTEDGVAPAALADLVAEKEALAMPDQISSPEDGIATTIGRFSSDRELLRSTAYEDGGITSLFARLERAALNQAGGGHATLSRYAIWANTVRDHISEAIKILRGEGDRDAAWRYLTLAHNSLSAFSEVQRMLDPLRLGQDNSTLSKPPRAKPKKIPVQSQVGDGPLLSYADAPSKNGIAGMKALSVRQPHAEAIIRGRKIVDDRSSATKTRGRILIYASLSRYAADEEAAMLKEYGINDVETNDLPRGVLIGTVELHDSEGKKWYLRNPERLDTLIRPAKQPKPVWFTPF